MVKEIKWSPRAIKGLEEICNFISQDSPHYSVIFAKRIFSIVQEIPDFPWSGRMVPEYGMGNLREKLYQDYRIVYRIKKDVIEIAAITHGARILKNLR